LSGMAKSSFQTRYALLPVLSAPSHQAALAAPYNVSHLLRWIIGAIQPDGQHTGPCQTISALELSVAQLLDLLFSDSTFAVT